MKIVDGFSDEVLIQPVQSTSSRMFSSNSKDVLILLKAPGLLEFSDHVHHGGVKTVLVKVYKVQLVFKFTQTIRQALDVVQGRPEVFHISDQPFQCPVNVVF